MNFLAHIYLSGTNKDVIIGNFIGDEVKGKSYTDYPVAIQKGLLLHREIDTFTDAHPIVRQSTKRLHNKYSHYSGVIVDILYDHFLAKNWNMYSDVSLEKFADDFYHLLEKNKAVLPPATLKMIPYMIQGNWLVSYATIDGISEVLTNMNYRTKNRSKMNLAVNELQEFYLEFETEFTTFFEELISFCNLKMKELDMFLQEEK